MKALLFTCILVPWLVSVSARQFNQDSQLIPGSLTVRELDGYFNDMKSRRAKRALLPGTEIGFAADEPDDSPIPEGGDASGTRSDSRERVSYEVDREPGKKLQDNRPK